MPLLLVAFYIRNYDNLFMMMFSQMAFKQIGANLAEYFMPLFKVSGKLKVLDEKYKETLSQLKSLEERVIGGDPNETMVAFNKDNELNINKDQVREYQTIRDHIMMDGKAKILDDYMELTV